MNATSTRYVTNCCKWADRVYHRSIGGNESSHLGANHKVRPRGSHQRERQRQTRQAGQGPGSLGRDPRPWHALWCAGQPSRAFRRHGPATHSQPHSPPRWTIKGHLHMSDPPLLPTARGFVSAIPPRAIQHVLLCQLRPSTSSCTTVLYTTTSLLLRAYIPIYKNEWRGDRPAFCFCLHKSAVSPYPKPCFPKLCPSCF